MPSNFIFLIGMPGAGKTYWGTELANHLGWNFIDLDAYIVHFTGTTIPDLFEISGEDRFRLLEHECLKIAISCTTGNTVFACGGGTPIFHDNLLIMKNIGCVIYLNASVSYLANRLKNVAHERPLLTAEGSLEKKLEQLLEKREAIYQQADHILQAGNISLSTFDQIIDTCINRH